MNHCIRIALGLLFSNHIFAQQLPIITPYHQQNIREVYISPFRQHTTLKPIIHADTSGIYDSKNTTRERTWIHRKLFQEHLFEFRKPDFNVLADLEGDFQIGQSNRGKTLWLNTRGVRVQGNVGQDFYFETSFYENQGVFPVYIDTFIAQRRVIPGQGEPKITTIGKSYDYSYVNALISYTPGKYLRFDLGYGNSNFIGDGYRSMLLSDIGFSYPYLRVTGTLGQFQYTAMWSQFMDLYSKDFNQAYGDLGYNKKWGVFHFLDWNVSPKLSIGLYDAVIWADSDSSGRKRGFDWSYLSPIIFLRPAESSVGSSDNALIGLNLKYKLFRNTILYGQLMLDEFKLSEMTSGKGWWGNKWAVQAGIRSFNLFNVDHLDLQAEFNSSRPYTYSFRNSTGNYAHFNQSLAHPLGANFRELVAIASYRYRRWYLRAQVNTATYGLDENADLSYGRDIFKSYDKRAKEYNNYITQGLKTNFLYGTGSIAFILNPKTNLRVEASASGRQEKNTNWTKREFFGTIGVKTSFRQFYYDF